MPFLLSVLYGRTSIVKRAVCIPWLGFPDLSHCGLSTIFAQSVNCFWTHVFLVLKMRSKAIYILQSDQKDLFFAHWMKWHLHNEHDWKRFLCFRSSEGAMAANMADDLEELRRLLHDAKRPRVQNLLSTEIANLEKVISLSSLLMHTSSVCHELSCTWGEVWSLLAKTVMGFSSDILGVSSISDICFSQNNSGIVSPPPPPWRYSC